MLRLEISKQYATIRVVPNGDEGKDQNFPRNLHNAAELFLKCGMVPQAVKLRECVDALLGHYADSPDGKRGVRLGKACVCWQCGYCGIPKDYVEGKAAPGPCFNCAGTEQINWVGVTQKSGNEDLPWIEEAAMTEKQAKELEEKKEKELAARRAAVEAQVAAAIAEREKAKTAEEK